MRRGAARNFESHALYMHFSSMTSFFHFFCLAHALLGLGIFRALLGGRGGYVFERPPFQNRLLWNVDQNQKQCSKRRQKSCISYLDFFSLRLKLRSPEVIKGQIFQLKEFGPETP